MSLLDLLILGLAAWRLAHLITSESGPFNLAGRFRSRFPLGGLTTCLKCASVWTAAIVFLLGMTPLYPLVWVLAISAASLMLASFSGVQHL